jgi:hypothetical protein
MNEVVPAFNEASIERALLEAQGDIFVASQLLGHVTVLKLHRSIRASERLQNVFLNIKEVKALPEFDRISQEQLEQEIARRMTLYRSDALDSLHDLATMPITENSAMAQVKLSAAARLAGGVAEKESATDMEQTLRALNESFHANAPRIKLTRETIEIAASPPAIEGSSTPAD